MSTTHSKHFNRWFYLAVILFGLSLVPSLAYSQTVTSVVPNSVRLEAGGKEVAITINGTGLDKFTSAQVVMNNQPVKEVQVVLGPATLKGRQVALKASSQATVGSNYQLRVMIGTVPINLPTQIVQVQVVKAGAVGGEGKTPTKVIKHEPRPLTQAEVDRHRQLVTTKKLTAIPHKAFTYQDFKDPKTGAPIKPDTIITLKNGKQIKGQDFINQINGLEKQFNTFGYTFRKARKTTISAQGVMTQPAVLQESVIKTKLMQDQRVKAAAAFQKLDPSKMKVKPYDKSSFRVATQALPQRITPQAVPQNLQQIVSAIKPYHNEKSYDQDWGDRDWFAVGIHAKMQLDADQNKMKAYAEGRATGTVYNQDWDIVRVTGLAEAPTQTAGQKMHAKLVANVCGEDFFTYEDSKDGSLSIGEDRSIAVDESVSFHFVIVVIPVEVNLGFRGSAGVFYGFELAPLKAKALFAPYVDTKAYAQVAVDLVVAKGGVGGELTLLKAALPIGATVGIETSPTPILFAEYYIQNTVDALSGRIYAFVEVDLWLWSDSWSWDIFKWDGFTYDGYLVIPQRDTIPIGDVKPPTPTYQLIVNKPGKGTGTVTSSPSGINCGSDCYEFYTAGKTVTLTATAAPDSYFQGWEGACSGTGTCTVTMNAATTVTATFGSNDDYDVTIFQDINYGGGTPRKYTIMPGQCQVLDPDLTKSNWNDKISSIKVGSKVGVALFEHIRYGGGRVDTIEDVPRLSSRWAGWNDKVSSLIVFLKENGTAIGVELTGKHWQFLPVSDTCQSVDYLQLYYNDDATKVAVPKGEGQWIHGKLWLTLYQDANKKGKNASFSYTPGGTYDIGGGLSGKASSATVNLIGAEANKRP